MGLATFLLGDVTRLARYVSSSTDARERQWRHFYYAQDTWRPTPKLTLNYGLRLDIINPQTVNEAGQRRLARPRHRSDQRRRRRRRGPGRQHREQAELGAAAGRHVSDRREDGDPRRLRAHLRHRRLRVALRSQRDPEPAGARVPGTAWRRELRPRIHPGAGTDRPELPDGAEQRAVRAAERHQHQGVAPEAASADRRRVQRHGAAPADRHRCRWRSVMSPTAGGTCLLAMGRTSASTSLRSKGSRTCPQNQRRPFFAGSRTDYLGLGGALRLDAGHRLFLQLREQLVRLGAGEVQQAVLRRLRRAGELHLAESRGGRRRLLFLGSLGRARRPGLGPHEHRQRHAALRTAVRQGQAVSARTGRR